MKFNVQNKPIRELTSYISRGVTPKYIEEDGIVVINQKCIRDYKVDLSLARRHDQLNKNVSKDKIVKKYDVLVNSTGKGTLGRVAQYLGDEEVIVDSHITIVRPDKKVINPLYFGFVLRLSQPKIESLAEGSTGQTELSRIALGNLEIKIIDDLNFQECVASILSGLDQKIWINELMNPNLKSISQLIFKRFFIDFELVRCKAAAISNGENAQMAAIKVISGMSQEKLENISPERFEKLAAIADLFPDELENKEYGEIPKGWKWIPLYDTAEYVNGSSFKTSDFNAKKEGLPIVKIVELKLGITSQTQFTTNEIREKYVINNDSLLYSWSGSPDTSLEVFKWFGGKGWLNQHIFLINTPTQAQKVFVFNLLTHMRPILVGIAKNKQTTGLGHVTVADMKRIQVPFPDENGFKLILEYLSPLYEMDSNNVILNENLKKQREALISKLLLGELEIN